VFLLCALCDFRELCLEFPGFSLCILRRFKPKTSGPDKHRDRSTLFPKLTTGS
jgi:hypothetical protein